MWQNRCQWTWCKTMRNIKENTFCVETCILATSLQETRRRFLSNFNLKHRQLKLTPGSKLVQKWFNKFRNLGTVDTSKSPGEVDHQTTGHHRASCPLRPAEPDKVHDLASGTGASVERLSKDHEGRLHIFYLHMNAYFSFMILRRDVLPTRLCPMPNGPFWALLDGGGNLLDVGGLVVRLPRVTYFYPLSPNYETCLPISVPTYSQG